MNVGRKTVLLAAASIVALCVDAFARGPIYLKDTSGGAISAGSNTPYSPRMTCSGATSNVIQFFGAPPVIGNAGCHASIINGYGLSRNSGTCKVLNWSVPGWVAVSASTQEDCDTAGGMWFPDLSALYESDPASAVKDHGGATTPYAVRYAQHGISAGYHFQQGRDRPWSDAQRGYYNLPPFTSSPRMFGSFSHTYNRALADLNESSPANFDMSAYDLASGQCAWCHPGGGNMEYDREGYRYDGIPGLFESGDNPDPKEGDYYSVDPNTGLIVSRVVDWQDSGSGEIDCVMCHTETSYGYSQLERSHALSEGKGAGHAASFGLAGPDGASGFLSIPQFGGDGVNPDVSDMSWNEQDWFCGWIGGCVTGVYLGDASVVPPKEACAQCHFADGSLTDNGPAGKPLGSSVFQKILAAGTADDGDKVVPGGKNDTDWNIFHGRSGTDKRAVSINDSNNPDAHMDAGTNCSTCHYLLGTARNYQDPCLVCHAEFYSPPWTDPVTPASPEIFPALTDGTGNMIQPAVEVFKIDHQFARGNSKPEGASLEQFDNTVTCQSCHITGTHPRKGSAPDPSAAHSVFPPFHFDRIDCKTCHIPILNGPRKLNVVDFTVGPYQESQRVQTSESSSGIGFRPLYVWRTKTHDGSGMQIVPVSVVTAALWGNGTSWNLDGTVDTVTPVLQRDAQEAAEALRTFHGDGNGNGIFDWPLNRPQRGDTTLIVNTQMEIEDMIAELRSQGISEPVMCLSFQKYTISHNVAPKSSQVILGSPGAGGCVMCHSSSDPASADYSIASVGFFDKTYTLFDQPAEGGAGIVQTAIDFTGTTTAGLRVKATLRAKSREGDDFAIDLSGSEGGTVRNTVDQDELLGLGAYASPRVAGIHGPMASFWYTRNGFTMNFDASPSNCPSGNCSYSWDLGDSSSDSGLAVSHTYAGDGLYLVTLTVFDEVNFLQDDKTIPISIVVDDLPPTVSGDCAFDANTWTIVLTDASTDDNGIAVVTVDWADGSSMKEHGVAGDVFTHTYRGVGARVITHKAYDALGQEDRRSCIVTPSYFTIGGTVFDTLSNPLSSAKVTVKDDSGVIVRAAYTALNGQYSVGSLKPGTYSLYVTKREFTFPVPAVVTTVGPSSLGNAVTATGP